MVKNTEKVFTTIKLEESTKASGYKIENKVMASWNTQIKTDTRGIGSKEKGLDKERMSIQTAIPTLESGKTTPKTEMESFRWQRVTFTKAIGLMGRKMVSVLVFSNLGKYRFTNGDIYDGNFRNGNR
jgi:hypothetical protein